MPNQLKLLADEINELAEQMWLEGGLDERVKKLASIRDRVMIDREFIFQEIRKAMAEGAGMGLDSAVRLIGMMVEKYTLEGHPHEAVGASAAMELVKELRKNSDALFDIPQGIANAD